MRQLQVVLAVTALAVGLTAASGGVAAAQSAECAVPVQGTMVGEAVFEVDEGGTTGVVEIANTSDFGELGSGTGQFPLNATRPEEEAAEPLTASIWSLSGNVIFSGSSVIPDSEWALSGSLAFPDVGETSEGTLNATLVELVGVPEATGSATIASAVTGTEEGPPGRATIDASITGSVELPCPPEPSAPVTLSVEPATGLTDGQTVTVRGTGLNPDAPNVLWQCVGDTDSIRRLGPGSEPPVTGCDISREGLPVSVTSSGEYTSDFVIRQVIDTSDGGRATSGVRVDCAVASHCSVAVFEISPDGWAQLRAAAAVTLGVGQPSPETSGSSALPTTGTDDVLLVVGLMALVTGASALAVSRSGQWSPRLFPAARHQDDLLPKRCG